MDPQADGVNFQYVSYTPQSRRSREKEGSVCSRGGGGGGGGGSQSAAAPPPRSAPTSRERGLSPGLPACESTSSASWLEDSGKTAASVSSRVKQRRR